MTSPSMAKNVEKCLAFVSNFHMLKNSLLRGDGETALFGPEFCDLLFFILQQR
jgi:hypothetical protein